MPDRVEGQLFSSTGMELPGASVEIYLLRPDGNRFTYVRAFSGAADEHGHFGGVPETDLSDANLVPVIARVSRFARSWSGQLHPRQFTLTPTPRQPTRDNSSLVDHWTLSVEVHVDWQPGLTLRENEPRPPLRDARALLIRVRAAMYPWSSALGIPLLSADQLPPPEIPTAAYLAGPPGNPGFTIRAARNAENTSAVAGRHPEERLGDIAAFRDQYDNGGGLNPPMPRPRIIADDYPPSSDGFPSDKSFAWQRLAGVNPVVLRLLVEFPKSDFPLEGADLRPYFHDFAALDRARQERRLYLADYEFLAGVPQRGSPRYLPAPFALFYYMGERAKDGAASDGSARLGGHLVSGLDALATRSGRIDPRDDRALLGNFTFRSATPLSSGLAPVAIQIDRNFDPVRNPIFTPKDDDSRGKRWGMAKLMVQVADINYHETRTHLGEAHLLMEAFKVAMERAFSAHHPLYALLRPHFEGLMAINYLAFRTLIAPGGGVERLLANALGESLELTRRAGTRWSFQDRSFRNDLAERGLLDGDSTIPVYPYRDDGLRVWSAIRDFVRDFLLIYYVNDNAVADDSELAQWLGEMNDHGVQGLPRVRTRGDLTDLVTDVIFNCSARHAAINYSQYDYVGFIPNMPGAAYAKPMQDDGTMNTNPFDVLPPAKETRDMVELMANLALYHYGSLGTYRGGLGDQEADDAAARFRDRLREVDDRIEAANHARPYPPYPYLMPRWIPNSTNV